VPLLFLAWDLRTAAMAPAVPCLPRVAEVEIDGGRQAARKFDEGGGGDEGGGLATAQRRLIGSSLPGPLSSWLGHRRFRSSEGGRGRWRSYGRLDAESGSAFMGNGDAAGWGRQRLAARSWAGAGGVERRTVRA
jgi:hypothetical protein